MVLLNICKKIVKQKQYFLINDAVLSNEAKNLIKRMVCSRKCRLGINGVD